MRPARPAARRRPGRARVTAAAVRPTPCRPSRSRRRCPHRRAATRLPRRCRPIRSSSCPARPASGKTTQLPKICLSIGRGPGREGGGLIGHTQPRRTAATSTAKRIAQELGSPVGEHVGYQVRFNDALSAGASVKLMTDGILLAETQNDPLLRAYDTIIIDEAHERSLNIDF
ncbi:hypothetical protein ACTMU2_42180 [Cupriavidus basilensis]